MRQTTERRIEDFVNSGQMKLPHQGSEEALRELAKANVRYHENHPFHTSMYPVEVPAHTTLVVYEPDPCWGALWDDMKDQPITFFTCRETADGELVWFIRSPKSPDSPTQNQRRRSNGRRGDDILGDAIDAVADFFRFRD